MKIIEIKRKVTGSNYSNLELTAEVDSSKDDITECVLELDKDIKTLLNKVDQQDLIVRERENKKYDALQKLDVLRKAIEEGKVDDLPF